MKKEPKRKAASKKKARSDKKEKAPKNEESKWQDFLRRHSTVEEKK